MKFTLVTVGSALLGVSLAAKAADNAQSIVDGLPQCAKDCIGPALTDNGCGSSDLDCACSKYGDVTLSLSTCMAGKVVTGDCSADDITAAGNDAGSICTDFTQDDLDNLNEDLSSLAGDISTAIPSITGALSSITSAITTPTASSGDDDNNNSGSQTTDGDNAGPRVTPMAWAGAAIAIAAIAL